MKVSSVYPLGYYCRPRCTPLGGVQKICKLNLETDNNKNQVKLLKST